MLYVTVLFVPTGIFGVRIDPWFNYRKTQILLWPTLPAEPLAASISGTAQSQNTPATEQLDEIDDANKNSILAVTDSEGGIYGFLDGSYSLGIINASSGSSIISLSKDPADHG